MNFVKKYHITKEYTRIYVFVQRCETVCNFIYSKQIIFFSAASEDEDECDHVKSEQQGNPKESYKGANDSLRSVEHTGNTLPKLNKKGRKSKSSIAKELTKIKNEFPIWNTKELGNTIVYFKSFDF